jgi:hypothetical protein
MAVPQETLELIMERMALDDDFRSLIASKPYRALGELGISVDEIAELRDAMTAGDALALGDRTSAAQTTWGVLMGKVSGGTWCGCLNKDHQVIEAYCD